MTKRWTRSGRSRRHLERYAIKHLKHMPFFDRFRKKRPDTASKVDRCTMDVGDLFEFVSNIAHYLVQSGPVIADGNTVGGSAEERILVHHRPSMIDKKKKVYKIMFEA